ncbi:N-carbamoyl-D-amino acid hydrolase [Neoasaia chiangmaiensis NBRC 101099]|uniref:N-carbamoyl-D-amino-acid hydrolase n=1 Tax=Neoasaia chiangmaiensis TaxID=320497 RepID=A0A1U9KRF8_9PROT|nr:N-carbamoyl-D-amino-acid hydrolase [Neoasaia chiangmaiensis]AQS88451.1 N-carbamoyl-D-amino-acid hydrolase [Neoasaia chiangmaiensis]GBR36677.1 N-carbamoyl-D-amino acid hydrolase [Neoasaia chiangmaiensis NBRC 101099]GEN15265.1 N-carbamoyl-D-amino-acid hydrolase [Neoasaia chiangmaiensis]
MSRIIRIAAAQMGPTQRADHRAHTLERMIRLLDEAAAQGATLVVFPELAFTTFFPRWLLDDNELQPYYEPSMPNPDVQPLFDRARELGVGFSVGYAERTPEGQRYNSSIVVTPDGTILGKYRKVHLPGSVEPRAGAQYQQLEKRYFEYGELGFPVFRAGPVWQDALLGMLICNDRRWPEAWRTLALQGMELLCVGYNSAAYDPNGGESESAELRTFHAQLVAQANAYMNACWAVAVAKAGDEDGSGLIGGTCIVDPNGLIVAGTRTLADEVIVADCDLDLCQQGKSKMFNFAAHRRPEHYRRITGQTGVILPEDESPA